MKNNNLRITGYSTALFSTWFFVEELGLLFDAGDGITATLLQKSRKIKHAFISHADRDHLTGLLQFNQLNAREGFPIIYYPADCGSFPALERFTKNFDPHINGTMWKPIVEKEDFFIKENVFVRSIRNDHVIAEHGISKSLSFKVFQTKRKLKAEFRNLSGLEIKNLIQEKGKDFTSEIIKENIISYSGDTPVTEDGRWENSKVLIHEATFLGEDKHLSLHGNKHSHLEEVIKMVSNTKVEQLILSHFSSRYSNEIIDKTIRNLCKQYKIEIPVFRVLPGVATWDILNGEPVNG